MAYETGTIPISITANHSSGGKDCSCKARVLFLFPNCLEKSYCAFADWYEILLTDASEDFGNWQVA